MPPQATMDDDWGDVMQPPAKKPKTVSLSLRLCLCVSVSGSPSVLSVCICVHISEVVSIRPPPATLSRMWQTTAACIHFGSSSLARTCQLAGLLASRGSRNGRSCRRERRGSCPPGLPHDLLRPASGARRADEHVGAVRGARLLVAGRRLAQLHDAQDRQAPAGHLHPTSRTRLP